MIKLDIQKNLHGSHGAMDLQIDLEIKQGSFVALLGESGAGKTTLLRILAGLDRAKGYIEVDEAVWLDQKTNLPPQKREIGFVFQDYALFDHMSVKENLLYVNRDHRFADELLAMTGLTNLAHRNVQSLSGGQKQRVSLCRAMMRRPKILLMDEPFSALDSQMKDALQEEIGRLHRQFGMTTIMVSHDTQAAYELADRIVVLDHARVIADGEPDRILIKEDTVCYRFSK
jgi:molybdate transport system ATP-binding protein